MHVQLFGEFCVLLGNVQVAGISSPRLQSLLAYLVWHAPAPVPRSYLAGLLTPEHSESAARRALSDALYRLRRSLGEEWLTADIETVTFADCGCTLDVRQFQHLAASSELDARRRAVELYRGDFLRDLDAEWLLAPRAILREQYLSLLEQLCSELTRAQQFPEAITYAHRWTLEDPLNEQAHRAAMQLYAQLGRYAAALQQYERLTQLLRTELDAEPLPDTRVLLEAIRAEYELKRAMPVTRTALIGRRRERALLLERVEAARAGRGGIVLVEGESGIGKTRLLDALAEGAQWRGMMVVRGTGRELAGVTPFAPLDQALSTAVTAVRAEQLRAQLDASTHHVLSGLVPRLGLKAAVTPDTLPALHVAIAHAFAALAKINPLLLLLDDVQWADASFWQVMATLAPMLETQRMLIVLAYRSIELRASAAAWSALQALDRAHAPAILMLTGFSPQECAELASVWHRALDARAALELQKRTGGNPLFVREVLAQPEARTATLDDLLQRRLAKLPVHAYAALEAAAVLGREFTHGVWQAIAGPGVLFALPALLNARLVEEDERGYHFQHDLARERVYHAIARDRLRDLHLHSAAALARENAEPDILAWHSEQADAWMDAVRLYGEAGDRAANVYAYQAAYDFYTRALKLAAHLKEPDGERLTLLSRRQRVLMIWVRAPELRADLDEIERLSTLLHDDGARLQVFEARLDLGILTEDVDAALTAGAQAVEWARCACDQRAEARVRINLGAFLIASPGRPLEAIAHLDRAVELAKQLRDDALSVQALAWLAYAQVRAEHCAAGLAHAQRALDVAASRPELASQRAYALYALGAAKWYLADWQGARAAMQMAQQSYHELGNWRVWADVTFDLTLVTASMGQHKEARHTLDSLIAFEEQVELDPESARRMWANVVSARLYLLAGDLSAAEKTLDGMQKWLETADEMEPLSDALCVLGRLRLAQGRPRAALAPFTRAIEISARVLRNLDVVALLFHALAAHSIGDHAGARASLARAEDSLRESDAARHDTLRYYARYMVQGASDDLQAAHNAVQRACMQFTDDQLRMDFLTRVELNREILARWQAERPDAILNVRLVRADVALGKALDESDFVPVRWTIDAGDADTEILERDGKVALRHHRLRRLVAQAHAQGAAPTDADLARALGVDIRTIERDMRMLNRNEPLRTRRRR